MSCKDLLRRAKFLELLNDEQIAELASVMETTSHGPGSVIVRQGDVAENVFFVVSSGECKVCMKLGDNEQELKRFESGDLFGEMASVKKAPYAANVVAVTDVEVAHVTISSFEKLFGDLANLSQQKCLPDPRKLIFDFFAKGDGRGPHGMLQDKGSEPEPAVMGESVWFAVFRPTSRDSIAKMISGHCIDKKEAMDVFTVGSKGMSYGPLPEDHTALAAWAFDNAVQICKAADSNSWASCWEQRLKDSGPPPSFEGGPGDSMSLRILEDLNATIAASGAVSAVGECWNYSAPQEFDDEYMVVWDGFGADKPWRYVAAASLQQFLMDRAGDGYVFPVNPVWPVRHESWLKVFKALYESDAGKTALQQWFSSRAGLLDQILALHAD